MKSDNYNNNNDLREASSLRGEGSSLKQQLDLFDIFCNCRSNSVGNRRFAVILSLHSERFTSARLQSEREGVAASVVHIVQSSCVPPGRFLMFDEQQNEWTILPYDEAVSWVYECFQRSAKAPEPFARARAQVETDPEESNNNPLNRLQSAVAASPSNAESQSDSPPSAAAPEIDRELAMILLEQQRILKDLVDSQADASQVPRPREKR